MDFDQLLSDICALYVPFGNFIAMLLALVARDIKDPSRHYLELNKPDSIVIWFKTVITWPYVLIRFTVEYIDDLLRSVKQKKKQ